MNSNKFLQALGLGLCLYLILRFLGWGLSSLSSLLQSLSRWYSYHALPYAEEAAIAFIVIFLVWSALTAKEKW